jgi:hypothetical protein
MNAKTEKPIQHMTPRNKVHEAIIELYAESSIVTPESLMRHTNLRLTAVKDALDALCGTGEIERESRGRYRPCSHEVQSRPISLTHLTDGHRKVEIGDDVLMILRLARQRGHHGALGWMLADLGYAPTLPIEPRDEVAELQRQFVEATHQMAAMASRLQMLQPLVERASGLKAVA